MARLVAALFLLLVLSVPLLAQDDQTGETVTTLIPLRNLDARDVALMFGGEPGPTQPTVDPAPARRDFAEKLRTSALEAANASPDTMREAGVYVFPPITTIEAFTAPRGYRLPYRYAKPEGAKGGGGFSALLPGDLTSGPIAFIDENAVIVQGSPPAIDEFREILALLDKAPKRVSLSIRLVALSPTGDEGLQSVAVLPSEEVAEDGEGGPAGSLLVESNRLVILRTALAVPLVVAPAEGQPGDYRADVALDAREFMILARVNADSSVSFFVAPADGPEREVPWPEAKGVGGVTTTARPPGVCLVKAEDGGTAVFAGLPRVGDLRAQEGGPIHAAEPGASADPEALLLITAHVLPPEDAQVALPR